MSRHPQCNEDVADSFIYLENYSKTLKKTLSVAIPHSTPHTLHSDECKVYMVMLKFLAPQLHYKFLEATVSGSTEY